MLIGYTHASGASLPATAGPDTAALRQAGCQRVFVERSAPGSKRQRLRRAADLLLRGDGMVMTESTARAIPAGDFDSIVTALGRRGARLIVLRPGTEAPRVYEPLPEDEYQSRFKRLGRSSGVARSLAFRAAQSSEEGSP